MAFHDILYHVDSGVGVITLNRPEQRNAQSWRMLEEIDGAFDLARADPAVRVVVIRGSEGCFSAGHDLGTGEGSEFRAKIKDGGPLAYYDGFKRYNLDLLLKWRNFEKPTIALVEGWCIYAGGFLIAPGLMAATGMTLANAAASSLLSVALFGAATSVSYAASGLVDWPLAGALIAGGLVGVFAGARLAPRLARHAILARRLFAGMILLVAAYVGWRALA